MLSKLVRFWFLITFSMLVETTNTMTSLIHFFSWGQFAYYSYPIIKIYVSHYSIHRDQKERMAHISPENMSVWLHKDHKCYVFKSRITGGEPSPLVTASELDVEVGDQSVDVVIPLHLQAEWWGEGQVLQLHRVNVHLLRKQLQDSIRPKMFNWVFIQ